MAPAGRAKGAAVARRRCREKAGVWRALMEMAARLCRMAVAIAAVNIASYRLIE
jgi:hypothetical protein